MILFLVYLAGAIIVGTLFWLWEDDHDVDLNAWGMAMTFGTLFWPALVLVVPTVLAYRWWTAEPEEVTG